MVNHATAEASLDLQQKFASTWATEEQTSDAKFRAKIEVLANVDCAIRRVREISASDTPLGSPALHKTYALITGSLHLVGRVLAVLDAK